MYKEKFLSAVKSKLIVSCQALPDEPLHSPFIMGRMALAALEAGASGVRVNSIADIQSVKEMVDLPVIGIIKAVYPNSEVFITPTLKEVRALAKLGCEVIAMDGTSRNRPYNQTLSEIVKTIKQEYPKVLLMADCSSLADGLTCEALGFDLIGTTLVGYTEESKDFLIEENDFELIRQFIAEVSLPIVVEGNIDTPEKARKVLELGAHTVVVGSTITRPQLIAAKYVAEISKIER